MAQLDYGPRPPIPERLPDGRLRAVRYGRAVDYPMREQADFLQSLALPIGTTALPGWPNLKLVDQRFQAPGDSSLLGVTEVFEELTPHSIYRDMAIQFPGVRPSAFDIRADFPFRTQPENQVVTVRVDVRFFVVTSPLRIPLVQVFRPISKLTGDAVSVLDDNSTTTSDEYLGWVASGTEFVDRCLRVQVNGPLWKRETYRVKAQ